MDLIQPIIDPLILEYIKIGFSLFPEALPCITSSQTWHLKILQFEIHIFVHFPKGNRMKQLKCRSASSLLATYHVLGAEQLKQDWHLLQLTAGIL